MVDILSERIDTISMVDILSERIYTIDANGRYSKNLYVCSEVQQYCKRFSQQIFCQKEYKIHGRYSVRKIYNNNNNNNNKNNNTNTTTTTTIVYSYIAHYYILALRTLQFKSLNILKVYTVFTSLTNTIIGQPFLANTNPFTHYHIHSGSWQYVQGSHGRYAQTF